MNNKVEVKACCWCERVFPSNEEVYRHFRLEHPGKQVTPYIGEVDKNELEEFPAWVIVGLEMLKQDAADAV